MSYRARCVLAYLAAVERHPWLTDPPATDGIEWDITASPDDGPPVLTFSLELPEADHAPT